MTTPNFCYSEDKEDIICAKVEQDTIIYFKNPIKNKFLDKIRYFKVEKGDVLRICIYPQVKKEFLDEIGEVDNENLFIIDFSNESGTNFHLGKDRCFFGNQFHFNTFVRSIKNK
jgi:hypothetical protein